MSEHQLDKSSLVTTSIILCVKGEKKKTLPFFFGGLKSEVHPTLQSCVCFFFYCQLGCSSCACSKPPFSNVMQGNGNTCDGAPEPFCSYTRSYSGLCSTVQTIVLQILKRFTKTVTVLQHFITHTL